MTPEERAERTLGDRDCWPDEAADYEMLRTGIADEIRAAVDAEREACAELAIRLGRERLERADARLNALLPGERGDNLVGVAAIGCAESIAAAIRERGV